MTTWTKQKLGSVATVVDCPHSTPRWAEEGYRVIRNYNLDNGRIVGKKSFVNKIGYLERIKRAKPQRGDIVLSREAPIGSLGMISDEENICLGQRVVLIRSRNIDANYLLYYLLSPKIQGIFKSAGSSGATVSNFRIPMINDLEISTPSLRDQQTIASMLSIYDDLIENNEKRIKILEEIAQRLYTEWFVKFRFPGHEKVNLVDSHTSFGIIPEGWEVVPISKIAKFINGYPFKPLELGLVGLPVVKIPELRSGILDKTPRNTGEKIAQKYHIKSGNILFSWSATLLVNIWNSGEALLNQHLFNVIPSKDSYRAYLFYTLKILVEKLSSQVVGATMQHLRKGVVESGEILLPSEEIFKTYDDHASKILEITNKLVIENQKIEKMRDLLIPQIITGKRGVKC